MMKIQHLVITTILALAITGCSQRTGPAEETYPTYKDLTVIDGYGRARGILGAGDTGALVGWVEDGYLKGTENYQLISWPDLKKLCPKEITKIDQIRKYAAEHPNSHLIFKFKN